MRCGIGYDIHKISYKKNNQGIWLGGIFIPTAFSLIGHSDADVLLHAITDALLGALGLGDIGLHFSDTDPINKNRSSSYFLEHTNQKIIENNYQINNIDCNIICEQPRIDLYRTQIQTNIASKLNLLTNQVNIKGKTNEKLDAVGEKRAIACQAIALLSTIVEK